jgi:hypothetical protein
VAVLPFACDPPARPEAEEDYGQKVAFAVETKWRTLRGWEVVDRYSVADAMAAEKLPRGCSADHAALTRLARRLTADVVVFGSASGTGATRSIRLCVLDCRGGEGTGKVILDKTAKMAYATDLRFILEDAVSAVTGEPFGHASEMLAILDPASVEAWKRNPNLVPNGDFTQGKDGRLAGWEGVIESQRYHPPWTDDAQAPLQQDRARMILWSPPPGGAGVSPAVWGGTARTPVQPEKVLQFALPESVAGLNGLACYSDWVEVKVGHRYRCAITYASDGPTFLPFVKGYALVQSPGEGQPQRREVYRRQFPKLHATAGKWETAVADFVPSVLAPPAGGHREPYQLKWIRVDLYCYWPKGHVWVKDATLKLVQSPGPEGKVLNPSAPVLSRPAGR